MAKKRSKTKNIYSIDRILSSYPPNARRGDPCHYKVEWTITDDLPSSWPETEDWVNDKNMHCKGMVKEYWEQVRKGLICPEKTRVPSEIEEMYKNIVSENRDQKSKSKEPTIPKPKEPAIPKPKVSVSTRNTRSKEKLNKESSEMSEKFEKKKEGKELIREYKPLTQLQLNRAIHSTTSDYRYTFDDNDYDERLPLGGNFNSLLAEEYSENEDEEEREIINVDEEDESFATYNVGTFRPKISISLIKGEALPKTESCSRQTEREIITIRDEDLPSIPEQTCDPEVITIDDEEPLLSNEVTPPRQHAGKERFVYFPGIGRFLIKEEP